MKYLIKIVTFFLLIVANANYAQLGFCTGSKGDPVFNEYFGNGFTYGPALPAGTTNYTYISGNPNDGFYTLFFKTNLYSTWHFSLDHTPDSTNGFNGKALIVNANANTSGEFYKRTVTGLCVNTTFEFSAWVMNIYNPNSGFCGAGEKPINVRFEIWNDTQTILLASGDTGNIMGTASPIWRQYGLVFTTSNQTSVVLIMKNNGVGGCGNDLAIDDIEFRSCGDLTTITNSLTTGDTYSVCQDQSPVSVTLQAATSGSLTYFYQWQSSADGINWADIAGANTATHISSNISSDVFYRVKAAQDAANLSNNFCSTISNIFNISFLKPPKNCVSDGDSIICSNELIPSLSVSTEANTGVNWYDAITGGNLLKTNSTSYTPSAAGVFYAEAYDLVSNCISSTRTPVSLTIVAMPTVTISGTTTICSGNTTIISFKGTPNAIVNYKINNGTNLFITLNGSGNASITTPVLTSNSTYSLISVSSSILNSCTQTLSDSVLISVSSIPTVAISGDAEICSGETANIIFKGTPNAIVTYKVNGGSNQTITLNSIGEATITTSSLTTQTIFSLISVSLSGTNGCTQTLSQSLTIGIVPTPTATISGTTNICSGNTAVISFKGTPNAIVNFKVDAGTNQTITLNNSGSASVTTPILTVNSTYSLISVSSPVSSACTQTLNGSVIVTVNDLPFVTITSKSEICSGDTATIIFNGTPDAIVAYTVNSGSKQSVVLNSIGEAIVFNSNLNATTIYNLVSVSLNGCMQTLSQSLTISVVPLPNATVSANPLSVCSGQNSTLNFSGTPNAIINYSENGVSGKTVILNSSGIATVLIQNIIQNSTFQLISVSDMNSANCTKSLSESVLITLNQTPTASYTGDVNYCSNNPLAITLTSDIVGTTFTWTVVQKGTSGASSGSGSQINQVLSVNNDKVGTATYSVTPSYNGCNGIALEINVTIHPIPNPTLTDGVICLNTGTTSSQPYELDTNLNSTDYTFSWFLDDVLIPNAFGNTYNANQVGVYSVIATSVVSNCESPTVYAAVSATLKAESLVINQSAAFSNNPTISVEVVGGEGPFLYQLDYSSFQSSNDFYNVTSGTHSITVVDESFCTNLKAITTVINYPHFFTPNNDGYNDTWNIDDVDTNSPIQIYDRYGKLLKEIRPNGKGWDGSYNGQPLFSNDYWFVVYYLENGIEKTFRSHFSLKR